MIADIFCFIELSYNHSMGYLQKNRCTHKKCQKKFKVTSQGKKIFFVSVAPFLIYNISMFVVIFKSKPKKTESTVTCRNLMQLLISLLVSELPDSLLINFIYQ